MRGFSLIFLPTLKCNAACEYCFEEKSSATMSLDDFGIILAKIMDYMNVTEIPELRIYWQGGEILTMEPDWFMRALDVIRSLAHRNNKRVFNELQTNLIGYGKRWNRVIREMFSNEVGSSLDFPNLYRKTPGGSPADYNDLWLRRYREARAHGIHIGVISLPNEESFRIGAQPFYSYYTNKVGLNGFQLNTPFPGGPSQSSEIQFALNCEDYIRFSLDLIDIWIEDGYDSGIGISPFDGLLDYFKTGDSGGLLCGMRGDCSRDFFCIDPEGNVSQCDCWVTSYPRFRFGNIFRDRDLQAIMNSPQRRMFGERPVKLIENSDCIECAYLSACHGG
ncbi:MAG TPA: radical SAM protein, partial [Desulfomonilaceae bacterium]|nr:radical SAM protein [Desulfomonilaceae bacterium]